MSPPPVSFDVEELLDQISWVRSLALRIASDAHVAEDLAQDAMLVALRGKELGKLASAPPVDASEPDSYRIVG